MSNNAMHAVERTDIVSGIWKFSPGIDLETLISLALEFRNGDDGENYLELRVRQCSKNSYGIEFQYLLKNGETEKKYCHKVSDRLKRRFGNDLVGWDLSSPTWFIQPTHMLPTA